MLPAVISKNKCLFIYIIYYNVKIAVIIQVSIGGAIGKCGLVICNQVFRIMEPDIATIAVKLYLNRIAKKALSSHLAPVAISPIDRPSN